MQVVLLLGALAVPLLSYTGVASWLRRKSGRATVPPPRSGAPATPRSLAAELPRSRFRDAPPAQDPRFVRRAASPE
jgi:uncharacterized iron-regulated membrane protein